MTAGGAAVCTQSFISWPAVRVYPTESLGQIREAPNNLESLFSEQSSKELFLFLCFLSRALAASTPDDLRKNRSAF